MATKEAVLEWRGQDLTDSSGDKIGKIEEIYLDQDTGEPEWALVNTGRFGTKMSFVPIADASDDGGEIRAPFSKDQVGDAPKIDADGELSQREETELYAHYGLDYGDTQSDSGLPEGGTQADLSATGHAADREPVGDDVSGRETDNAMTRSEEELRVGTTARESGRARLRKYVVTENVTTTVPVQREEVRIEREPITDANAGDAIDGPAISEEEHEVVLHEEEVVVDKRAVPKERIRMDTETITEQREVSEDVAREQVEVLDADGEPGAGRDGVRGTDEGVGR